ncbi:MAG TPA: PAS domain S-box protein [Terriglobales bacterium]|nr:PAS domain S-box protein [Terriglobales bacterium]
MARQSSLLPISTARSSIISDEVFRLLVNNVIDYAIFVLDPEGHIHSWNKGAERLMGYTSREIIGKHFRIFYSEPDLTANKPMLELQTAKASGDFQEEGWRIRKNGSRFWGSVLITRIVDNNGKLLGFGKIIRDLTERRLSDLRYRLLVQGVEDYAIFSMDANGYITSWNVGGERIKGYKPEEIIGKHFSVFYTPEDQARSLPEMVLHTAATQGHFEGEGWRVRRDGTPFWASVVVTALRDEEGHLYGFSKVTRDMTERKKLLDTIRQHSQELELRIQEREETSAELEAFAYSVSHDLRAPLRAIGGFADALREDCAPTLGQQGLDYLNEITNATARMNALVQDLLEYGRVSRINLSLGSVSLSEAVKQAIDQLGSDRRGSLTVDVPAELRVESHPQVLAQVVLNYLTNAFKFHEKDSTPAVHVFAEQHDDHVRLSVRDNGIGIAPRHQERIWQVFERLHDRETYPGSGIGLAIVRRAAVRMHGSCGVDSESGKGSTFWIELPASKNGAER